MGWCTADSLSFLGTVVIRWGVVFGVLTAAIWGSHVFATRVQEQVHLTEGIALDVYLTQDACTEALAYVDALQAEQANALLVSNCLNSKAFRQSPVEWRSEMILPPEIYQAGGHQLEKELGQWLQKKSDTHHQMAPEQFQVLNLLDQSDVEASLTITQFLCAHRDLLVKLPKPTPSQSWQQNQYALLNTCIQEHRDYRRSGMDEQQFGYSKGASLLKVFEQAEPAKRHFVDVLRTAPH